MTILSFYVKLFGMPTIKKELGAGPQATQDPFHKEKVEQGLGRRGRRVDGPHWGPNNKQEETNAPGHNVE